MTGKIIRLTKNLTFDDLRFEKVKPIDAYAIQVRDWIIEPAKYLATLYPQNTDHGIALLALELMFFEPHGQYLIGQTSDRASRQTFCIAFDRFKKFLQENNLVSLDISDLNSESIYKFARCGLFHSLRLANEILVDAVGFNNTCLGKNPVLKASWLVNPWLMINTLEQYVESYVCTIQNNPNSELERNFHCTFDRLLREPMNHFCGSP